MTTVSFRKTLCHIDMAEFYTVSSPELLCCLVFAENSAALELQNKAQLREKRVVKKISKGIFTLNLCITVQYFLKSDILWEAECTCLKVFLSNSETLCYWKVTERILRHGADSLGCLLMESTKCEVWHWKWVRFVRRRVWVLNDGRWHHRNQSYTLNLFKAVLQTRCSWSSCSPLHSCTAV